SNGETLEFSGRGFITEEGFIGLTTSPTSDLGCEDGVFSLSLDASDPGFFLVVATEPQQAVFLAGGVDVDNFIDGIAFINPTCATVDPTLEITELAEDQISGTYTAEFFTLDLTNPGNECENYTNLGPVEVVFNVALEPCN
ncbi:MAG: hypothetical protein AAF840_05345, partial [Bacteroidota bacterium]